jgi:hypothetical protein
MSSSAMNSPELLGIVFLGFLISLWSKVIWGGWAEKFVAAGKASDISWFWFRVFAISQTPSNRLRFIKSISLLGIFLATLGIVGLVFTSHVAGL